MDVSKYPMNDRGYTVIPCFALTSDTMSEDLVGFQVTIGLKEAGQITIAGIIKGYDDKQLLVQVGNKTKRFDYDPEDICLSVYQFSHRILFSNEAVASKQEIPPLEPVRLPEAAKKKERKKKEEKKEPKTSYVPKHGIVFG